MKKSLDLLGFRAETRNIFYLQWSLCSNAIGILNAGVNDLFYHLGTVGSNRVGHDQNGITVAAVIDCENINLPNCYKQPKRINKPQVV